MVPSEKALTTMEGSEDSATRPLAGRNKASEVMERIQSVRGSVLVLSVDLTLYTMLSSDSSNLTGVAIFRMQLEA